MKRLRTNEPPEPQQEEHYPDWSDLPAVVLRDIFLYLNHNDRSAASLVCRTWQETYGRPALWHQIAFSLGSECSEAYLNWLTFLIEQGGHLFQELELTFNREQQHDLTEKVCRVVQSLTKNAVDLNSLKMATLTTAANQNVPCAIFNGIKHFVRSQHSLSNINFSRASLSFDLGVDLLNELHLNAVQNLDLMDYVNQNDLNETKKNIILTKVFHFPNLTALKVDYQLLTAVNETAFLALKSEVKELTLQLLLPRRSSIEPLRNNQWEVIKELCPLLSLNFIIGAQIGTSADIGTTISDARDGSNMQEGIKD